MAILRRIHKRVTFIRGSINSSQNVRSHGDEEGFRIEVYRGSDEHEGPIYVIGPLGTLEVEESGTGEFRLTGMGGPTNIGKRHRR